MNTDKTPTVSDQSTAAAPPERPSRILLVDDEPKNRFLMRDILANGGYEVVEAESGRRALELAEAGEPDAVLLDVMMPEMDGFETCRQLRKQESTRLIPVLMVSALNDRPNRLEGISAGAVDFITRPIDVRDMLLRVDNAVSAKRLFDEVNDNCERLQQLEQERGETTRKIVHDLRGPLGGISGNLQLLQMLAGDRLNEEEKGYLQSSLDSVQQMVGRVDTLLLGSEPKPETN